VGGKLIFSVKNPLGDKYRGDFADSCDEEKFQAVVIL
jgi:hypothetical protein